MGVPISSLPAASSLTGDEVFPIVQGGSTKRTTLNDIPYTPAGTGAVATTVQAKQREFVSVFDFMTDAQIAGVKSGSQPDVTAAIQAAISFGRFIYFPPGQYKITASIDWENQWLVGAVDNGALSTAANQTMIIADGTFPAFRYYNASGFNAHGGGIKNFNIYFADGSEPATVSTRPNAIGFFCDGANGYPAFHTLENITVRGGQWAVFDTSGSWMAKYKQIQSDNTIGGIYKRFGTTHTLESCYHRGGKAGYWFQDVLGVTLNSCALDLVETDIPGYYPLFVENSNVVWNGGDFEDIKILGNQRQIVLATGVNTMLQLNGARFLGTEVTSASEQYLVQATNGAVVQLNAVDFTPTSYSGSSGLFAYLVAQSNASISVKGGVLPAVTGGTPSTVYSGLATSGFIDYDNITAAYQWGRSQRVDKSIRFSANYDFPAISPNSRVDLVFDVPGAVVGDFAHASLTTQTTGIILEAWVNAADQVTISANNVTASTIDPAGGVVRIRVVQQ